MLDTASNARPAIIRAQEGTTTGISAADRAATFRALASPTAVPSDFNRPGHVFPLRPREGGVLARDGHTEASVDFCRLAGLRECGVLSEICNEDGSMSRVPEVAPRNPPPLPPAPPAPQPPRPARALSPGLSRRLRLSRAAAHLLRGARAGAHLDPRPEGAPQGHAQVGGRPKVAARGGVHRARRVPCAPLTLCDLDFRWLSRGYRVARQPRGLQSPIRGRPYVVVEYLFLGEDPVPKLPLPSRLMNKS